MTPEIKENEYTSKEYDDNEERVEHKEIEELIYPMEHLLSQLRDRINRGEYTLIIGDDASGRIPTLIFDKVLKALYRERGHAQPKTLFFAGSNFYNDNLRYGQGEWTDEDDRRAEG